MVARRHDLNAYFHTLEQAHELYDPIATLAEYFLYIGMNNS